MGIQPAVFFANFFMFHYELDFARRAVAARRIDIIHHFRFTARFVDDIIALNNKMLTQYLYTNMSAGGIHGIYPTCIRVTLEQYSFVSLNYLDITIFRDARGVWHTKIYNKRHHAPLNKIKHITFPHIESYISRSCKFNIVTSQLTRFFRICSLKPDFLRVTLDFLEILARKMYPVYLLKRYVRKFVSRHRYMYGVRSPTALFHDLFRDLARRLSV